MFRVIISTILSDNALILFCFLFTLGLVIPPQLVLSSKQVLLLVSFSFIIFLFCGIFHLSKQLLQFLTLLMSSILIFSWLQFNITQSLNRAKTIASLDKYQQVQLTIEKVLHQGSYQTVLATTTFDLPKQSQQIYRLYLNWQPKMPVFAGEKWQASINLRPINSRLNLGGFDRQTWLYANHIDGRGSVRQATLLHPPTQWRDRLLTQAIKATNGLSQQGLLLALGFGEKALLPPQTLKKFQQTGTAHLIAISGLHIGLAFFFGFLAGRAIQYLFPTTKITPAFPLCGGILLALFYSLLAGLAIPTQRAMIAISLVILLKLSRYHWTHWQILLRVIVTLLIIDPLSLLSDSFWLSVLAVTVLLCWHTLFPLSALLWRDKPLNHSKNKFTWLLSLLHLQLGLTILFLPVQIFFFHGIAWSSFWFNLWLVPLFSLILVPLILLTILSFNSISWHWANSIADFVVTKLNPQKSWQVLSHLEQLQFDMGVVFIILISLLALRFSLTKQQNSPLELTPKLLVNTFPTPKTRISLNPTALPTRKNLYRLIILTYCLLTGISGYWLYLKLNQSTTKQWQVEMIDVGQGLAILIVKNNQALLFDTGSSWRGGSMAELEIRPYLQRQGLNLNTLILSHDDNDHSGGARGLIKTYPQIKLISSSQIDYGEKQREVCYSGKELQWQGLSVKFLAPFNQLPVKKAKNPHSCVVLISDKHYSVLLTGDIEQAQERALLPFLSKVDLLQVAHHGSKSSSSLAFLQRTQPTFALISAGRFNQWHFPHSDVINRLKMLGIKYYNSGEVGQVQIRFTATGIKITTARSPFSAWYKQPVLPNKPL